MPHVYLTCVRVCVCVCVCAQDTFNHYDRDGDGIIELSELETALHISKLPEQRINRIMKEVQRSGDTSVSRLVSLTHTHTHTHGAFTHLPLHSVIPDNAYPRTTPARRGRLFSMCTSMCVCVCVCVCMCRLTSHSFVQ